MIPCKHCNTLNSLDSTFCKRCGTGLPEDQLAEAKAELEQIVDEGFNALNLNHFEEAFAIAESATASDPSSVRALSLKASCHERRGEIAEALECAERIVELNPNSELDKIKRNQLRSALAATVRYQASPGRSVAVLAGVSAAVLVMCVGLILARRPDTAQATEKFAVNGSPANSGGASLGAGRVDTGAPSDQGSSTPPSGQNPAASQNLNQTQPPANGDPGRAAPDSNPATQSADPSGPELPNSRSKSLPPADPTNQLTLVPVPAPGPPASTNAASTTKPASKTDASGDPPPTAEGTASQGQTAPTPPDPGQIHITVHSNGAQRIGSSGSQRAGSTTGGSAQMYSRLGQEQLGIGNYSGAANAFDQALKSGGDPIVLNHWLGLSYQHLGRKSDALSAFQSAIESCKSALSSGRGNTAKIQATKEACEEAVSQLHGG